MRPTKNLLMILALIALFAITAVASAQALSLSPLQFLPGDETLSLAAFEQKEPVIAQGGDMYLAVWTDARTDAGRKSGSYYDGNGSEIYAARLDANGNLIDTVPIIVSNGAADQSLPDLAWNGQNWLVIWTSQEPTQFYWSYEVMAARVSPQGQLLDAQPIRISNTDSSYIESAVASDFNGSGAGNWAVFWQGNTSASYDVMGMRIAPDGRILDPGGKVIQAAEYYVRSNLDAAFAQDEYLLSWQGINVVQGKRLRSDLSALDATYFNISSGNLSLSDSAVATNGTDFFAVWEGWTSTTYYDSINASRVSHAGQVLDPNGIIVWADYGGFTGREPRVAWGGSNWFVSFLLNGVKVLRVSPTGAVIDPNKIPADFSNTSNKWAPESSPASGGGIRLVWQDTRAGGSLPDDIYTAGVTAGNALSPEAGISRGAPTQLGVSAAANGNGYLLAFRSDVSGNRSVKAQLVDANGAPLWAQPVEAARSPSIGEVSAAWNGSLYLLVWNDTANNQIYGRRLNSNGTFADPAPFAIMPGSEPGVAAVGDRFLVTGTNAPTNPQYRFTFAARVQGSSGAVLDAPRQLGNLFAVNPDVAAFSNRWIVVWERHPSHDDPTTEIQANFVNLDGTIGSEFTIRTDFYTVRFHYNPSVGASGDTALVVWQDPRASNSDWNLYGRRVRSDGTLLDSNAGFAVNTAPNNQGRASVAWDGAEFVVGFEDQRANTFFMDMRTDVFATRVNANGQVLDPGGFAVMNAGVPEIFPDTAGANGQAILSASVYRDVAPFMAYRTGLRILAGGVVWPTATPTATPTKAPLPTATFTSTPVPSATPVSSSMHSGDLDGSGTVSGRTWQARVTITVHGSNEALLSGVTVSATWSGGFSGTAQCITDSTGSCSISSGSIRKNSSSVTFTVNNLSRSGFTYNSAANHDPDGDSNGTQITVRKP